MRKFILTPILLFLAVLGVQAQMRMDMDFDYGFFKSEDGIPYVEAYMKIFSNTYQLKRNANGTYTGDVEITLIASSTPDKVDWFDKYLLTTGEIKGEDTNQVSMIDVKRFAAKEGKYRLDLTVKDKNSPTPNIIEFSDSITIRFASEKPTFSTPILVDRYSATKKENVFSRSGYDIIPNTSGVYGGKDSVMAFYTEIYDTDKFLGENERFVVKYYVKKYESQVTVLGTEGMTVSPTKKLFAAVIPINIKNVGPGYHSLVIELRNKTNEVVTSVERVFLKGSKTSDLVSDLSQVGTDFMALVENVDTLREYIMCLDPITPRLEQDFARNVIKNGEKDMMKRYIVSFWLRRSPSNPQLAWLKYKAQVSLAQRLFGTQYLPAYKTDRGRVFLQYGPPNVRSERPNEPGAWPYEIWQYYEMYNPITDRKQTNRRFVFWCRNEASNNYELLHSDALGEQKNERWELVLYNRGKGTTDIDQTEQGIQPGGQSRDLFNNPR